MIKLCSGYLLLCNTQSKNLVAQNTVLFCSKSCRSEIGEGLICIVYFCLNHQQLEQLNQIQKIHFQDGLFTWMAGWSWPSWDLTQGCWLLGEWEVSVFFHMASPLGCLGFLMIGRLVSKRNVPREEIEVISFLRPRTRKQCTFRHTLLVKTIWVEVQIPSLNEWSAKEFLAIFIPPHGM